VVAAEAAFGAAAVTAATAVVCCLLLRKHVLLRMCVLLRAHVLLLVCLTGTAKNGVSNFVAAGVVAVVLQGWTPRSLLVYCWYQWGNAAIFGA
jgi:hypothetical protein